MGFLRSTAFGRGRVPVRFRLRSDRLALGEVRSESSFQTVSAGSEFLPWDSSLPSFMNYDLDSRIFHFDQDHAI